MLRRTKLVLLIKKKKFVLTRQQLSSNKMVKIGHETNYR